MTQAAATIEEMTSAEEMSDEEAAAAFGEEDAGPTQRMEGRLSEPVDGAPEWAALPPGFQIPPGKRCGWMRFRAGWTEAPQKGDRWCLMWTLSEAEEKLAYKRSQGDSTRALMELAKATIRVVDPVKADRTGMPGPGNVNAFWAEIGTKCRQMIQNYYLKTHSLSPEEQQDFFANCFAVTTAVAG